MTARIKTAEQPIILVDEPELHMHSKLAVQELMGHKTIAMTKRYSHPTLEHKKRAVQRINSGVMDTYFDTSVISLGTKTEENSA